MRPNINAVVDTCLSPTHTGVGVRTSLIWAVDQTLLLLRESGKARLHVLVDVTQALLIISRSLTTPIVASSQTMPG